MTRPSHRNAAPPRQQQSTLPRARDENGYEIDEHDLPINGPARQRALNGRPDPAITQPVDAGANEIPPTATVPTGNETKE
jgi:hypothetical protein